MNIKNNLRTRKFQLYINKCCLIALSVEKKPESKNRKVVKTKNGRIPLC